MSIIRRVLGFLYLETDSVDPTEETNISSLYSNNVTGDIFIYNNDEKWDKMNSVAQADMSLSAYTTAVSLSTSYQKLTIPLSVESEEGIFASTNNYEYDISISANYYVETYLSLDSNSSTVSNVYLGTSTGTTIQSGNYNSSYIYNTTNDLLDSNICLITTIYCNSGDTLSLYIKSDSAGDIKISAGRFIVKKLEN